MKKKYVAFTAGALIIAINLMIPACGSKNSLTSPYSTLVCTTGQVCTGVSGTPMFPSAILTSLDNYGSMAQIQIYASNGYTTGASTSSVTVQAQVYIVSGAYPCGGGTFYVQGTGNWVPNYGGSLGLVQAQLTGSNGFYVNLSGEVYSGQDTTVSQQSQFGFRGSAGNACDPNAIAL
jgi:hypothetical protein